MTSLPLMPSVVIDGRKAPQIAFGLGSSWSKRSDENISREVVDTIKMAVSVGFTHIDCSDGYGTERDLGVAVKELEQERNIPRSSLHITTKCMTLINDLPTALAASLERLQMDYVDLYLVHSPFEYKNADEIKAAWAQMENLREKGLAHSIGVSNFRPKDLEPIYGALTVPPAVNQIECHPYLQRLELNKLMRQHGTTTFSYGPLVPLLKVDNAEHKLLFGYLQKLAEKYQVSKENVLMRWQLDRGHGVVITATDESRLHEYLKCNSFVLTAEEVDEIGRHGVNFHFRSYLIGAGKFDAEDQV